MKPLRILASLLAASPVLLLAQDPAPTNAPAAKPAEAPLVATNAPAAKPAQAPAATNAPAAKPATLPTTTPVAKPVAKPATTPVAKPATTPVAKPVAKPATTPTAKPAPMPAARPVPATRRDAALPPSPEKRSAYDNLLAEKLSVGVSLSSASMDKTHVPYDPHQEANFLGNINRLDESDMNGVGVVVRYAPCPYLAVQFSNDLHAELGMWNNENESRDANFVLEGFTYELLLMLPIEKLRLTPYVGLGYTDLSCSIDYNGWWHYGWDSPASYNTYANGSKEPRNSVTRWMEVDEPSSAFTFSAGVSVQLWRYAQLDLFWRTMSIDDADISFYRDVGGTRVPMREGYVPLECSTYGGALRVVF